MRKLLKRLKNKNGFTLAETLAAVLIMLLASAVMAAGIPAAANAYNKAVDAANAQVLLSTAVNALRDELSTAWEAKVDSAHTKVTYNSSDTGLQSTISLNGDVIEVQEYENWDPSLLDAGHGLTSPSPHPLVSNAIRRRVRGGGEMFVTYENVFSSGNIITFHGLTVKVKDSDGRERIVAKLPDRGSDESILDIRVLR